MTLTELIQSIREDKLTKQQLEDYYTHLATLYAEISDRLGDLEKKEAIFMASSEEKTRAGAERVWDATEDGLEEIGLKRKLKAVEKLGSSVKHRIFNVLI
jgi:hypothetical protein